MTGVHTVMSPGNGASPAPPLVDISNRVPGDSAVNRVIRKQQSVAFHCTTTVIVTSTTTSIAADTLFVPLLHHLNCVAVAVNALAATVVVIAITVTTTNAPATIIAVNVTTISIITTITAANITILKASEWRDGIKMTGNVAAVRAVPGRSQDNRCRYCHNEVETLAHVLGSCPHGKGLQNARHHQVRSIIATALKDADYNTFEEVHGLSVTGSTWRIDIIAFKESTRSGFIIDPTVRFETNEEQPAEVDKGKKKRISTIPPFHITSKTVIAAPIITAIVTAVAVTVDSNNTIPASTLKCNLSTRRQLLNRTEPALAGSPSKVGLEVNPEKTKYMILSRDENIVRNVNIKIGNLSFEEVEKFKYLGATLTNINDTREEIKHRINMENACYYSVEKLLSSSQLSKNLKVRIYKTVILPVVLYGCETWTLTLREEQRLRVFENKVLRKIFGAKRDEVTREWRKLHNAELHALYSSPDIIRNIKSRRLRWAGHVARMGEPRNAYRVLVEIREGKRPLGKLRCRWEDNIKIEFEGVGI
ncbi:hypothetical protein ANN_07325 [Periplaneta americana]|uniref:Reverse transcriptase domain-containing protein n=1 Tax=Periplaneta americana TaxID=6978 RepID=A0ABQ8SZJ5_PERAM|nr:hypothetical protein ANN_07325 [Periplaneta americana]